jgi:hypothetical protein
MLSQVGALFFWLAPGLTSACKGTARWRRGCQTRCAGLGLPGLRSRWGGHDLSERVATGRSELFAPRSPSSWQEFLRLPVWAGRRQRKTDGVGQHSGSPCRPRRHLRVSGRRQTDRYWSAHHSASPCRPRRAPRASSRWAAGHLWASAGGRREGRRRGAATRCARFGWRRGRSAAAGGRRR